MNAIPHADGEAVDHRLDAMEEIVRVAVVAVTIAFFASSVFAAALGYRNISIVLALAAPLGLSAWGFLRAGYKEAAVVLLACVLIVVVTLVLVMNPLGVHNVAVSVYQAIVLVCALMLSRRAFGALLALALGAGALAFLLEIHGLTESRIPPAIAWPSLAVFLALTGATALIGRFAAEKLAVSIGDAARASGIDPLTGLRNRAGFFHDAAADLHRARGEKALGMLAVADLDHFSRMNFVIGHRAADEILQEAARRVRALAGPIRAGRIGDDDFAILALGLPDEAAMEELAGRLRAALTFEQGGVAVRCAVGYARFPRDAVGPESLLIAAESALAAAKGLDRDRVSGPADRL